MAAPRPERDPAVTGRHATISFELFPPATAEALVDFDAAVDRLGTLGPSFISVTYGAGGTTRERTRGAVDRVAARAGVPVAHHLTCVAASRGEIDALAHELWEGGIRRIVALRGDPPGGARYTPLPDGYAFAADLVAGLVRVAPFDVSVAAYPEVHPQARSAAHDLDNLKRKVDAGARRAITQYCFDTDGILRFVDRARVAGIDVPIVPGIMPINHFGGLARFSKKCGALIPDWLGRMFEGLDDDPAMRAMVAASVATEQCRRLMEAGLSEFHFYTLNKADVTVAVCRALGLGERLAARHAA